MRINLSVSWNISCNILDELIEYEKIESIKQWVGGFMKLLNGRGDLFEVISDLNNSLSIMIVPSEDLIWLHENARRRYEAMDTGIFT